MPPSPLLRPAIAVGALVLLITAIAASVARAAPAPAVVQSTSHSCLADPSDTLSLAHAVAAGDTLLLLVGGQGYGASAAQVRGVTDNVNGAWTALANPGPQTVDAFRSLTLAAYAIPSSQAAPNGLTVTVSLVSGQSAPSAVALDISGRLDTASFPTVVGVTNSNVMQAPAGPPGDLVVGLFAPYQFGQGFTPAAGWTADGAATACSAALAESQLANVTVTPAETTGADTLYLAGTAAFATSPPTRTSAPAPTSTAPPTVVGTPQQGQTLTAGQGGWSDSPTSYAYQWQRCTAGGCTNIAAATGSSYTVAAADVGDTVDVVVTATNSGGSTSAVSGQTATVQAAPAPAPPPPSGAPAPMTNISLGQPAYGDGNVIYAPSNGNSTDYGSRYRCGAPCGLIIDLSKAPAAQRGQAVVSWYNDDTHFYASAINNPYYNEPRDYTIEVNAAPGGGAPPASGWTTLASVSGNLFNAREHVVNLGGANWIRMEVTATNGSNGNADAAFHLDVASAASGTTDTWLMLGDSITQDDMGHYEPSNFMQQVNAARPDHYPSEINGGIGGWDSGSLLQNDPATGQRFIDAFLAAYPGHYVSLDFGTNDANGGNPSPFLSHMTTLVQTVLAAGKVPVLRRSIPWGCTAGIKADGPAINADLQKLLSEFPQAVPGPDDWSYFQAHPSLISRDCIHPDLASGAPAYRQTYVAALLSNAF